MACCPLSGRRVGCLQPQTSTQHYGKFSQTVILQDSYQGTEDAKEEGLRANRVPGFSSPRHCVRGAPFLLQP